MHMTKSISLPHGARRIAAELPFAPGKRFGRSLELHPRPDLVRIGSEDGGWTVPDDLLDEGSVCYSAGAGTDVSFDMELIRRYGCSVFCFDPTPTSAVHIASLGIDDRRFRFLPVGIWSEDASLRFYEPGHGDSNYSAVNLAGSTGFFEAPVRSLPSLMAELGHAGIDLLKMDIEGAEYEAIRPVLEGKLRPTVLCIELHKVHGLRMHHRTVNALEALGYRAVCRKAYDVTFVGDRARPTREATVPDSRRSS